MQGESLLDRLKSNFLQHKRLYIALLVVVLGALVLLVSLLGGTQTQSNQGSQNNQGNNIDPQAPNPFVSNSELDQVDNAFRQQYKKAKKQYPEKPEYKFNYQVGPSLSERNGSLLPFAKLAHAVTACNLDTAPATVTGYLLKSHLSASDAASIAKDYQVDTSTVSSLPGADGVTFDYYFSNPQNSSSLKVSEPSGTYQYHSGAISSSSADIAEPAAQVLARKYLADHNFSDKLKPAGSSFIAADPPLQSFSFSLIRDFGLKVIDTEAIKEQAKGSSVCNIGPAKTMNFVDVLVRIKGDLGGIVNQTRTIKSTHSLTRLTIDDSVKEYQNNLPLQPIVDGVSAETAGTVTLDEAALVYFDYGESYGQYSYVPVYLTSGKTASGTRVYTIFPAVAEKELTATPLSPSGNQKNTLQLETFKPAPPKPPGKLCYGNQVDYVVKCTQGSTQVCNRFFGVSTKNGDPWGVCTNGCQKKGGVISVAAGEDACKKFLDGYGIPTTKGTSVGAPSGKFGTSGGGGGSIPPSKFKGGDVVCAVSGCPC